MSWFNWFKKPKTRKLQTITMEFSTANNGLVKQTYKGVDHVNLFTAMNAMDKFTGVFVHQIFFANGDEIYIQETHERKLMFCKAEYNAGV